MRDCLNNSRRRSKAGPLLLPTKGWTMAPHRSTTARTSHPLPRRSAHRAPEPPPESGVKDLLSELETCDSVRGRRRLLDGVVREYLGVADAVAARYRGRGIEEEDLVQVARMALVKAALRYRSEAGENFAAYAVPTMVGEVKRYFRDSGWAVRPTRRLQEARPRVADAREQLAQSLGREPSRQELASAAGLSVTEVEELEQCSSAFHALSLDLPPQGTAPVLADTLEAPEDHAEDVATRLALCAAVARLDERARTVIRMYFVEERTQAEIGALLGLTQMKISRILRRALEQLRRDVIEDAAAA